MNILYFKYALEIAKCGSINRAAENLYVAQPNLSRAIKDLESDLGISIFMRTSKGMKPTPEGERFLRCAEGILRQVDEVEHMFREDGGGEQMFSISVPRAGYIGSAFSKFSLSIEQMGRVELYYKETNAMRAIKNILQEGYRLGIIRYAASNDHYFKKMLDDKGLTYELITEFTYNLVMSQDSPLAAVEDIRFSHLRPYIEIAHGDPYVPSLSMAQVRKEELPEETDCRIFVFERASQFELLSKNPHTFMWMCPLPEETMIRYGLVARPCVDNTRAYKDMLIYRKDYRLTALDKSFITYLCEEKRSLF